MFENTHVDTKTNMLFYATPLQTNLNVKTTSFEESDFNMNMKPLEPTWRTPMKMTQVGIKHPKRKKPPFYWF